MPRTAGTKFFGAASSITATKTDILPSPRLYSGFLSASGTDPTKPKVFVAPAPYVYNGPQPFTKTGESSSGNKDVGYSYTTYTYDGSGVLVPTGTTSRQTEVSQAQPSSVTSPNHVTDRSVYIRNLSLYEGGHVYTSLSFIGEARSTFFRDGKFPIVIVDIQGRVIGVSYAVATTEWSIPGWVRFSAKINYALPSNTLCTMVFEEALTQVEKSRQPLRVPLPITCN